jgi:hypothetical protein
MGTTNSALTTTKNYFLRAANNIMATMTGALGSANSTLGTITRSLVNKQHHWRNKQCLAYKKYKLGQHTGHWAEQTTSKVQQIELLVC